MKRWFLAVAGLLVGSVGVASADYVIIIANLGQSREVPADNQSGPPGFGMVGGIPGGGPGFPGGPGGPGGGGFGLRGGLGGGDQRGGVGLPGGGFPGGFDGRSTGGDTAIDPDAVPLPVAAIVEVAPISAKEKALLNLPSVRAMTIHHKYGITAVYSGSGSTGSTKVVIVTHDGKRYPTVLERFAREARTASDNKNSPEAQLALAEYALTHGLLTKFGEVMDKLAQDEAAKGLPAVTAYLKVKADLDKPVAANQSSDDLRRDLLGKDYQVTPGKHYVILHQGATNAAVEVDSRLRRLEQNLRVFYFWFALKGHALPVPTERMVVAVTAKDNEYKRYHQVLGAGLDEGEGFFAPRENLAVLLGQRRDVPYNALEQATKPLWSDFNRSDIIKDSRHIPGGKSKEEVWHAQTMALLMRVMEDDAELAAVSHDGTRQLLYDSGLLPRGVAAPEWVQFGLGSFFETPVGSPWMSPGAPSYLYLPVFKELSKRKRLEKTDVDTLRKVITNSYFRYAARAKTEGTRQKAESTAWALTYYLAQRRLDGLLRFYQELAKMPRDLELDDEVLLGAFARAFDCVDANKKIDQAKLAKLAEQWVLYVNGTPLEAEEIYSEIRKTQAEMRTQPAQNNGRGPGTGGPAGPGNPPGGPGGKGFGPRGGGGGPGGN